MRSALCTRTADRGSRLLHQSSRHRRPKGTNEVPLRSVCAVLSSSQHRGVPFELIPRKERMCDYTLNRSLRSHRLFIVSAIDDDDAPASLASHPALSWSVIVPINFAMSVCEAAAMPVTVRRGVAWCEE